MAPVNKLLLLAEQADNYKGTAKGEEAQKLFLKQLIQDLCHSRGCKDKNCELPSCRKLKKILHHTKVCKRRPFGGCRLLCRRFIDLFLYHAKYCSKGSSCLMPYCRKINHQIKEMGVKTFLHEQKVQRVTQRITEADKTDVNVDAINVCGNILSILECCVCLETVKVPFKQCSNGHICCSRCLGPVTSCPTCRAVVNQENPVAMKHILEALPQQWMAQD